MEFMIDMYNFIGCKIRLVLKEGTYEGIVHHISPAVKTVTLNRVHLMPENVWLGTLCFAEREVESYTLIERLNVPKIEEKLPRFSFLNYKASENENFIFGDIYDDNSSENSIDLNDLTEEEYVLVLPPHLKKQLAQDHVIISAMDDGYEFAMNYIFKERTLGVSLEGYKIGRHGQLNWLCISTSICTFLFDIKTLKKIAFEEGLKEVMEDPATLKIFHDCQAAADCLYHQYNTVLTNVFDTQVADYFINLADYYLALDNYQGVELRRYKAKKFPKSFNPLYKCLMKYLNLSPEYINIEKYQIDEKDDPTINSRPITNEWRDAFIKNCIYLPLLKTKLLELLMSPYNVAVNVHLEIMRDSTDEELLYVAIAPHMVPIYYYYEEPNLYIWRFKHHIDIPEVVSVSDKNKVSVGGKKAKKSGLEWYIEMTDKLLQQKPKQEDTKQEDNVSFRGPVADLYPKPHQPINWELLREDQKMPKDAILMPG